MGRFRPKMAIRSAESRRKSGRSKADVRLRRQGNRLVASAAELARWESTESIAGHTFGTNCRTAVRDV